MAVGVVGVDDGEKWRGIVDSSVSVRLFCAGGEGSGGAQQANTA